MIVLLKCKGRWHPANLLQTNHTEWKLGAYHEPGFEQRSAAIDSIKSYLVPRIESVYGTLAATMHLERDHPWDGEKNQAVIKSDTFGLVCIEWLDEIGLPLTPPGVTIVLI